MRVIIITYILYIGLPDLIITLVALKTFTIIENKNLSCSYMFELAMMRLVCQAK